LPRVQKSNDNIYELIINIFKVVDVEVTKYIQ